MQGPQSTYFRIEQECKASVKTSLPAQSHKAVGESLSDWVIVQALVELRAAREKQRKAADIIWDKASKTEISP